MKTAFGSPGTSAWRIDAKPSCFDPINELPLTNRWQYFTSNQCTLWLDSFVKAGGIYFPIYNWGLCRWLRSRIWSISCPRLTIVRYFLAFYRWKQFAVLWIGNESTVLHRTKVRLGTAHERFWGRTVSFDWIVISSRASWSCFRPTVKHSLPHWKFLPSRFICEVYFFAEVQ